jgi:hypothetical protein
MHVCHAVRGVLPPSTRGGNHPTINTSRIRRIRQLRIRDHNHGRIRDIRDRIHVHTRDRIRVHIRDRIRRVFLALGTALRRAALLRQA